MSNNTINVQSVQKTPYTRPPEIKTPEIPLAPSNPENDFNCNDMSYNEEPQEESYPFLVKRAPIASQKYRRSETSLPEIINELLSDNGDNASEEDNERNFEDITSEYSSDDSEEDYQVNFDAPEMELGESNYGHAEGLDHPFLWIVVWILKYQESEKALKNHAESGLIVLLTQRFLLMYITGEYGSHLVMIMGHRSNLCHHLQLAPNERFKPSNILTLALILDLSETFKNPNGEKIRGAIICCSCDIPAARKLCGNQLNFGGLADIDSWFIERNVEEIKNNALAWKKCKTQEQCQNHISKTPGTNSPKYIDYLTLLILYVFL
ncbi:unnamed protein product [Rhizophagus irregularis]|nr:unnamed protein product [Rhizophagus irregularis]